MLRRSNFPEVWRGGTAMTTPFREINRLQRRIDQIFDDFMNTSLPGITGQGLFPWMSEAFEAPVAGFHPMCDVEETDRNYVVSFDIPGVRKEELKIELRDNQLTVSGERHLPRWEGATPPPALTRERYHGSFLRSFTLPHEVDPNKVEAIFENGVLQITIPKVAVRAGKTIPVKEGRLLGTQPAAGKTGKPGEAA